eukprot:2090198-Pyramimonas_sp.AAC.1
MAAAFAARHAAAELEDRLGATMNYIRAAENGATGGISPCLERPPAARDFVDNPQEAPGNLPVHLRGVRGHARERASQRSGRTVF